MKIKPFHKARTRVSVECHVSLTNTIEWLPGRVDSIVSALDRPYRLNIRLDNGSFITEAAPECVREYEATDAEIEAWHQEEMKKPRTQVVYSREAQAQKDAVAYPYGQ